MKPKSLYLFYMALPQRHKQTLIVVKHYLQHQAFTAYICSAIISWDIRKHHLLTCTAAYQQQKLQVTANYYSVFSIIIVIVLTLQIQDLYSS